MSHRVVAGLFMLLASVGFANTADAAKLGSPFRVNTETGGDQDSPALAGLTNGNFVIVWKNFGQSGQNGGIYFKLYGPGGIPKAGETRVNSPATTVSSSSRPSVAPLNNGGFVVAWSGPDVSSSGVYMRRFNANGVPLASAVRCNTHTQSTQTRPTVARLSNGGFIVAWNSSLQDSSGVGVYAQLFNAIGGKVGNEFRVNENTFLDQANPSAAGMSNGLFVIAWSSDNQDHDGFGIYGRGFANNGTPAPIGEFRANSTTDSQQYAATIAAMSQGKFIIAWYSFGQDGSGFGIYAQRYAANGATLGNEFRVNFNTLGDQLNPAAAGLAGGAFVVVWDAANKDGSGKAIVGRQFNADGTPDGGEILVNTFKPGDQINPAVAQLANGDYVVAWVSVGQDGSGYGVYAQRFRP